jgi:hypothetical protein
MLADHFSIPFPVTNYRRGLKDTPINWARVRTVARQFHLQILDQWRQPAPTAIRNRHCCPSLATAATCP